MPRLEALGELKAARRGQIQLTPRGWYQLTLAATDSKQEAERAMENAIRDALKSGNDNPL